MSELLDHLGINVPDAKAVELGNDIIFEAQLFPKYHESYYASFWHDPYGFMLRSFVTKQRSE